MQIERLLVQDFRNFAAADLALGGRFTVIYGENGAGKSNLLEALYLVSTLRSFRVAELAPLVRHGADEARVELRGVDPALDLGARLAVHLVRTERSLRRVALADGKVVRAAADFYGRARAILFTPEDLAVLRGAPGGRRNFLDRVLFARDRAHIADIQAYEKLLRSRNHVLRVDSDRATRERLLESYEVGLAAAGARIWTRRERLLAELRAPFVAVFQQVHGEGREATIAYACRMGQVHEIEREAALLAELARRRGDDILRGTTGAGPHRDDFEVRLDGHAVGAFASQGQTRALILAFKIAELRAARDQSGELPLLLLDDVSSELDPVRNAQLFRALAEDAGQCILTTTAPDFIRLADARETAFVEVSGGTLRALRSPS